MDLGIRQAGFLILAAIEQDPYCCQTLQHVIEQELLATQLFETDITTINPTEWMQQLGLAPGQVDLLFGGPPCQAFSQIGKQKSLEDGRGLLLFQMVRFAASLQPKVILIEQVKGLLNAKDMAGQAGGVLKRLLQDLEALGYQVQWQVLNAAAYGVAQTRQRLFIIASRLATPIAFPNPTHSPQGKQDLFSHYLPYTSVGEVICDLGSPDPKGSTRLDSHIDVTPQGDRLRIEGVPEGSYLAAQQHLPKTQIKNLTAKDTTKFLRLAFNAPSKTLRGGEIFFHPIENRYLTPREYMRLHGFPDEYKLKGPIRGRSGRVRFLDQHRQIANAVPPPMARQLALAIRDVL
jgi:DNA (cytosine-5)-methyltransferase 1